MIVKHKTTGDLQDVFLDAGEFWLGLSNNHRQSSSDGPQAVYSFPKSQWEPTGGAPLLETKVKE